MPWVLAIDFGTTATAAAVRDNGGESRSVMLADGSATLSSSVFAQGEQFVVGSAADNLANWALDAYEPTPKRRVGQARVLLGGREFAPSELIAAVLASILEEAVRQLGEDTLGSVTLTHPVSWGPTRRQVLAEAFSAAASQLGLTRLGEPNFVPEPVAAAHWYARQQPLRTGDYIGVYDLGGGTFDTAVLRKTGEDAYEVVKSGGIDWLGGVDFDYLLSDYLGQRHIADANPQLWEALSPQAGPPTDSGLIGQRRKLQETVKTIKEQLTHQMSMNVYLPGVPGMVLVTRAQYEELIADHIEKTVAELEDTIAEAGLTPDDLTAIYRIGGAARTPLVGDKLDRLQRPVRVMDQPKLVVAQGAAVAPPTAITRGEGGFGGKDGDLTDPERPVTDEPGPLWTPTLVSDPALNRNLQIAGIDAERAVHSSLILDVRRLLFGFTITHAEYGIEGRFGLSVDRGEKRRAGRYLNMKTSSFDSHVIAAHNASRRAGWVLHPPHKAAVAGVPAGRVHWQTLTSPDGARRNVLCGFAQQDHYVISTWFGEAYAALIAQTYVNCRDGTSGSLAHRSFGFIAQGITAAQVSEKLEARVTAAVDLGDITAMLSPAGSDYRRVAESLKASISSRGFRLLTADEPDTFVGGLPCLAYQFASQTQHAGPRGVLGPLSRPVTGWAWVGEVLKRVLTIQVTSSYPGAPAREIRDLVKLARSTP